MATIAEADQALSDADEAFERLDVEGAIVHLSTAVEGLTAEGDARRAAMVCVRLGDTFANLVGNVTASWAWFRRARRLVQDLPACPEQGWVAVAAMGCDVNDPDELLAGAELALDRARRFGDVNLETKALADAGLAHVQVGNIAEGMNLLDEAMALACGPADDSSTSAKSVCSFFTACYFAVDFERADTWTDLLRSRGLIGHEPGGPVFLSSHCDRLRAALLVQLGRWSEAEAVLTKAQTEFVALMAFPGWHPAIGLAELRVRQGRLADAEALLLGKDQLLEGLLPMARVHLCRGDHELARVAAERGLRSAGQDRLRSVELLDVLVDAALASGDLAIAQRHSEEMASRVRDLDVPALLAQTADAEARVLAAAGRPDAAITMLERAVDGLGNRRLPWRRALLLLHSGRIRDRVGDVVAARMDVRAAASLLASLDVVLDARDAATLERLGDDEAPRPVAGRPAPTRASLVRDRVGWRATADGTAVRLRDSKGLRYLATLVAAPTAERHVLDLVDAVEGVDPDHVRLRRVLGDAGPAADAQARAAYRRRIEELRVEIDDAMAADRLQIAEARQDELDVLVQHLAQTFGIGGRDRTAASAAERARLNVTRALRTAISRIADDLPGPGSMLDRRVRTGLYCAYEPTADDEFVWTVHH